MRANSRGAGALLPLPRRLATAPPPRALPASSSVQRQQQQQRQYHQQQPADAAAAADATSSSASNGGRRSLDWVAQHKAATVASWSGLCYVTEPSELEAQLEERGLRVVASGRNEFTSWFVADGEVDAAAFARAALARRAAAAASPAAARAAAAAAEAAGAAAARARRRERFVLLRGVQWAAPEMDAARMWGALVRAWPRPLAEARPDVVAHGGVAEMAEAMFAQLRPYLDQAEDAGEGEWRWRGGCEG